MSAQDFNYDPTAAEVSNLVTGEVHHLASSVGVLPTHGLFYRQGLEVEATTDGATWVPLRHNVEYRLSPMFLPVSAATGLETHSFIVIHGAYIAIRLRYQVVGQHLDNDLLTTIAQTTFNRLDPMMWLQFKGAESYNPRTRDPDLASKSELEIVNSGLTSIKEQLEKLAVGAGKATGQQVTALEVRQTTLEGRQDNVRSEFTNLTNNFNDVRELFFQLEDFCLNGRDPNSSQNGGFLYSSEEPLSEHVIVHGLNSNFVDITVWALDRDDNVYRGAIGVTKVVDENTISIKSDSAVQLLAVVRPPNTGAYTFSSSAPGTEFIIPHGLKTGFPSCEVWVEDSAGDWVRAITNVEMLDEETIKVTLTEAHNVRVVVQIHWKTAASISHVNGQHVTALSTCSPHRTSASPSG